MATELGAKVYACDPCAGKTPVIFSVDKRVIIIGTNTTSQAFVNCKRSDRGVVDHTWLRDCYSLEADDPSAKAIELTSIYMLHVPTAQKEVGECATGGQMTNFFRAVKDPV